MNDLKLEGYRFVIHLRGSPHENRDNWGGGCSYVDYKYTTYWWSGTGRITDMETKRETGFTFGTISKEHGQVSLKEAVLTFSRDGSWLWRQVVQVDILDMRRLADIIGAAVSQQIDNGNSDDPLPHVVFGPLKLGTMVETGIVPDPETGQIHLPLAETVD